MLSNIGPTECLIRTLVGAGAIATVYIGPQTPWGWLGLIPLITGVLCFCPLYGVIGCSTANRKSDTEPPS